MVQLMEAIRAGGAAVVKGIVSQCEAAQRKLETVSEGAGMDAFRTAKSLHARILVSFRLAHALREGLNESNPSAEENQFRIQFYVSFIGMLNEGLVEFSKASQEVYIDWQQLFRSWWLNAADLDLMIDVAERAGRRIVSGDIFRGSLRHRAGQSPADRSFQPDAREREYELLKQEVVNSPFIQHMVTQMQQHELQEDGARAALCSRLSGYAIAAEEEKHRPAQEDPDIFAAIDIGKNIALRGVIVLRKNLLIFGDSSQRPDIEACAQNLESSHDDLRNIEAWFRRSQSAEKEEVRICQRRFVRSMVSRGKTGYFKDCNAVVKFEMTTEIKSISRRYADTRAEQIREVMKGFDMAEPLQEYLRTGPQSLPQSLYHHPQSIIDRSQSLLSRLHGRVDGERLRTHIQDLSGFAEIIQQDARSEGVLWCEVEHLRKQRDTLDFISNSLCDLEKQVTCLLVKPPQVKKSAKKKNKSPSAGAGQSVASADLAHVQADFAAVCSYVKASIHCDFAEASEAGGWQSARRPPSPNKKLGALAKKYFSQGTFASPWASLVYHYAKHTHMQPRANMETYIERARQARSQWTGHYAASIIAGEKDVKVVSTAQTWLVFADDDEGRIISYRDRSARPY